MLTVTAVVPPPKLKEALALAEELRASTRIRTFPKSW
jgi:hypothetical protein